MISIIVISIVVLAALILATVAVLRKLDSPNRSLPVTAEWIDELSIDRYRPAMRLLDSRDIEFLRSQAGFTPKMEDTTREQAPWLKWWYDRQGKPVRSHGCAYADSWSSVSFQRMPNVSLLPGKEDRKWDDLIAATDKGIAIIGDGSFSIDQQRYNAQFGGQLFYEIKGGKR